MYDRLSQMARLVKRANNRARATYPGLGVDDGAPGGTFDVEAGSVPEGFTPAEWEALARVASDERTVMQIRTDLFLDIGITGYPSVLTCTDSHDSHDSHDSTDSHDSHDSTDSRESRVRGVSDDSGVSADSSNRLNGCRNLYCFHTSTRNDAAKGAKRAAATASGVLQTGEHAITSEVGSEAPGYAITNAMLRNITAHVQVVIPMFSLLTAEQLAKIRNTQGINKMEQFSGCTGAPDLAGYGPIPPDIIRLLLGTTPSWDRLLTNPVTGVVVTADQYSPTASVRRALVARDMHCRFPGCRIPAKRCEVDHTIDWDHGGKTVPENLAHLCVKHHSLKHHSDWTVEQHAGGVMKWVSPLGRAFTDTPVSTVMFQPATKPGKPAGPTEPTGPINDTPPPF